MLRSRAIHSAGLELHVTNEVSDETLAAAYLRLRAEGLLDRFFHERTPGIVEFLRWCRNPDTVLLAAFLQRGAQADLAGLGWLFNRDNLGPVQRGEVGVAFFRKNRSVTSELSEMMLDYAFQDLGLTVAIAKTPSQNRSSLWFLRRVGFISEVRLPAFTLWKGQPSDLVVSHLTSERWEKGGGPATGKAADPSRSEHGGGA
jgi:RimJ/RimL family protein N-acetyltransferase